MRLILHFEVKNYDELKQIISEMGKRHKIIYIKMEENGQTQ